MEQKIRQKAERLIVTESGWNRQVKAGVSFQRKVGQKFRSRRDRQKKKRGPYD